MDSLIEFKLSLNNNRDITIKSVAAIKNSLWKMKKLKTLQLDLKGTSADEKIVITSFLPFENLDIDEFRLTLCT